jgi:Ca-activated chloride channel homolog
MRWWIVPIMLFWFTARVQAQGWIDPIRPNPDFGVHKLRTAVTVHVTGRVASVEVEEWFRNDGAPFGEGDYLYPLPGEAVFSNFSLFQGDKELRGETMDAARARSIYEEIVRRKKDPALIELAGHGLLRARVFPIAQGETRKVTLRYTQMLSRAGDALQFRYAAGERNIGGVPRPVNGDVVTQRRPDNVPLSFTLLIDNPNEFGRPFSPSHEVVIGRAGGRVSVRPERELSGDFDVFLPLARAGVGLTMITHRPSSENGYFMLTLSPGKVSERAVPRDVTVVLDVSGSMSGEKMEQARTALHTLLQSLSANDRFRLIAFSDQVRVYRNEWLPATGLPLRNAEEWIDRLRAEGGTNIAGALDEAFVAESPANRLPFVIFITDGLPSIGEQNPERIANRVENARGRARVFAFGVGYDVNTYLLDRLSAAARGTTQYVRPSEDVERAIAALATKIRFPVLADLKIGNTPVRMDEVYPVDLPDLFADEELVIVGRYHATRTVTVPVTVTVSGNRAGRREAYSTTAQFADHSLDNDYIPKIWASRKVGYLSQQLRLHGNNKEILDDLRETALRYGILSEFTAYLVQEPVTVADQDVRQQRAMAPAPMAAVGASAVANAEASRMRREAKTAVAADMASESQQSMAAAGSRMVAGRAFKKESGGWVDVMHRANRNVIVIEPFSDAYFSLLRALPELQPYWKSLTDVTISGKRTSIKLAAGGAKQLDAARIADIVARFRT